MEFENWSVNEQMGPDWETPPAGTIESQDGVG